MEDRKELVEGLCKEPLESLKEMLPIMDICVAAADEIETLQDLLSQSEAARADLGKRLAAAQKELAETKAELDAAIYDLKKLKDCSVCAYLDTDCPHGHCEEGEEFRWRGLKEA